MRRKKRKIVGERDGKRSAGRGGKKKRGVKLQFHYA